MVRIANALERLADHFAPRPTTGAGEKLDQLLALVAQAVGQPLMAPNGSPADGNGKPRPDWYTTEEAAKELGWSSFTIRQRCRSGLISAKKSGGRHRIAREEVERIKREGLPAAPART